MFANREHVTIDRLLKRLQEKHLFEHSRSRLYRLMQEIGFRFKKSSNRKALCEQKHVVVLRQRFLREYVHLLETRTYKQFVYLDETWIFAKGGFKRSWDDGSSKCVKHTGSEGKRYIILHARSRNGFITGADLVFSSTNKSSDYHDSMNAANFKKWLETQLLPQLKVPSIIIMDNAAYHSEVLNRSPTSNWRKGDIQKWLENNNLPYDQTMLKAELLGIVKNNKEQKEYVIDSIVSQHGHKVLRLPPYHCQFNPIEMVWGICKNYYDSHIGRDGYGDEHVKAMWLEALSTVTPEIWAKCVDHAEKEIVDWWEKEQVIEQQEVQPLIFSVNTGDSDFSDTSTSDE
jgi:transposase